MNELLAYEVLKAIGYKGDRIEKGSIVHMTASEAGNIGEEYLQLADNADDATVPAEPTDPETPSEDTEPKDADTTEPEDKPETQTDANQE